jgi:hypothetical protein
MSYKLPMREIAWTTVLYSVTNLTKEMCSDYFICKPSARLHEGRWFSTKVLTKTITQRHCQGTLEIISSKLFYRVVNEICWNSSEKRNNVFLILSCWIWAWHSINCAIWSSTNTHFSHDMMYTCLSSAWFVISLLCNLHYGIAFLLC